MPQLLDGGDVAAFSKKDLHAVAAPSHTQLAVSEHDVSVGSMSPDEAVASINIKPVVYTQYTWIARVLAN